MISGLARALLREELKVRLNCPRSLSQTKARRKGVALLHSPRVPRVLRSTSLNSAGQPNDTAPVLADRVRSAVAAPSLRAACQPERACSALPAGTASFQRTVTPRANRFGLRTGGPARSSRITPLWPPTHPARTLRTHTADPAASAHPCGWSSVHLWPECACTALPATPLGPFPPQPTDHFGTNPNSQHEPPRDGSASARGHAVREVRGRKGAGPVHK